MSSVHEVTISTPSSKRSSGKALKARTPHFGCTHVLSKQTARFSPKRPGCRKSLPRAHFPSRSRMKSRRVVPWKDTSPAGRSTCSPRPRRRKDRMAKGGKFRWRWIRAATLLYWHVTDAICRWYCWLGSLPRRRSGMSSLDAACVHWRILRAPPCASRLLDCTNASIPHIGRKS